MQGYIRGMSESLVSEPRDLTRVMFGPRPYTVTVTNWHGQNPIQFATNGGDVLPDAARAYYNEQRAKAMAARDAHNHNEPRVLCSTCGRTDHMTDDHDAIWGWNATTRRYEP